MLDDNEQNEMQNSKRLIEALSEIKAGISELHEDIIFAVAPKSLEISVETNDLIELATDIWRMEQRINKILASLDKGQKENIENSLKRIRRYLDKNDIEIMDHTNQKYHEGQNLEILAVEKDPNTLEPIIKETREPTILHKGQVIRIGKVIVASNE